MAQSFKLKVNTLLTKLGDRDTFSIAAAELESISRTLDASSLPTFLSCILSTHSSDKAGFRKQCLKLISLLACSYSQSLSPFVPKILSHLLRRLRDPDSAVRSACVDAVSALSSNVTKCGFSSFLKPLCDAVFTEQDQNAQIGAALCLAAAIDGTPDPDPGRLGKIVPRLEKLVKCDAFRAKAAGLTVIGSVIGSGGVSGLAPETIKGLVNCLVKFLTSEDWAARKAASEALWRLAVVEKDSMAEFKSGCLRVFEARKFDKVKAVREVMNQMLEAWKQVPDVSEESSPPPSSQVSSKGDVSDGRYPPGSKVSSTPGPGVTQIRKKPALATLSTPPGSSFATTARKRSPLKSSDKKTSPATFLNVNRKKDWKVEIAVPNAPTLTRSRDDDIKERSGNPRERRNDENGGLSRPEIKRALFPKNSDDKMNKFGRLKSGSRVTPCPEETHEPTAVANSNENHNGNHKECEDLSLIRSQLVQIEKQQSSLLDLLQRFIGSSQSGMRSLETRVHGLELALDEISYDLAVSSGRMSNSHRSTCCLLPGAEFWSSKFWRKPDARFSASNGTPIAAAVRYRADRNCHAENLQLENQRLQHQGHGAFIVNPLAEIHSDSRGDL
ncbi:hypothetical protein SLEP1_g25111 [Rubroshorea leprosula]|uniref:TORTIFOLIA1/SINE1-2 N-terminal domain-containing protein n=1 Tax=Rubroshorea leprosula TaxID=152421 RepID=A0AAV5JSB2_9ROSI|nr:hypothetical protein SLEP1_g25111 [Rubroshorea leprosula]